MHSLYSARRLATAVLLACQQLAPPCMWAQKPQRTPSQEFRPREAITEFVHTSWTAKDGAPTDVRALAQSTDGYLWLGTPTGLFRFDGVRFVRFEPRSGDILPDTRIQSLLASRDGSLWIVWGSGAVSRLLDGRLTSYSEREGLSPTFRLAEGSDGILIAGTTKGLARFSGARWKDEGTDWPFPGKQARRIYFDRSGALWVLTEDRVLYRPAGQSRFVDPSEGAYPYAGRASNFAQAPDGTIWLAEVARSAHTLRRLGDRSPVTEVLVGAACVLFDRNESLWVGSAGDGLRRVAVPDRIRGQQVAQFGPQAKQFTTKDGLSGDIVMSALEDREGNIWFGTVQGLDRFRAGAFTPVSVPHPDRPRLILPTRDGSLWTFALNMPDVLRITPRGRQEFATPSSEFFFRMFEDETGGLWAIVTWSPDTLARFQGGRFHPFVLPASGQGVLQAMTSDRAGGLWLLDQDGGLFRFARGRLTRVADQLERLYKSQSSLYSDRQGRLWLGQYDRAVLYDQGRFRVFGPNDGVPPGLVLTFFEDHAGNLWAGGDGGLSKFEHGRFHPVSQSNGLPERSVYGIAEDNDGAWWIASQTSVLRIPAGELDHAIADSAHRVRYRSFDILDGLPGRPQNDFATPVVARTTNGRIWFVTSNGIAYVDPGQIPRNTVPPPVHIEAVKVAGRELSLADGIRLSHQTKDLEIDYTALSLSIPERVHFRYKLEGWDTEWRDVGTRRQAYYTGLAPGKYRFRVAASNNDGVWNEAGAAWSFSVEPAFYQTTWFLLLSVLLSAGVMWSVGAFVVRRRTRLARALLQSQFQAALAERSRIATDLHDTLLQGFAGLTLELKTAELALPEQPDVAAETLARVQQLAGAALREARESVWDLRSTGLDELDLVEALQARAVAATVGADTAVKVSTSGERRRLPRDVEVAAFRIGREAVANAVRHADARVIEIALDYGPSALTLEVRDNGCGLTDAQRAVASKSGHFGITGMEERARRAGGSCEVRPRLGGGTVVALQLPLEDQPPPRRDDQGTGPVARGKN